MVTTIYPVSAGFTNNQSGTYSWANEGLCLSEISSSGASLENRAGLIWDTRDSTTGIPPNDVIDSVVLRLYCPSWYISNNVIYGGEWNVYGSSADNVSDITGFGWADMFDFAHYMATPNAWGAYDEFPMDYNSVNSSTIGIKRDGYTDVRVLPILQAGGLPQGYSVSASFNVDLCRLIITHHAVGCSPLQLMMGN